MRCANAAASGGLTFARPRGPLVCNEEEGSCPAPLLRLCPSSSTPYSHPPSLSLPSGCSPTASMPHGGWTGEQPRCTTCLPPWPAWAAAHLGPGQAFPGPFAALKAQLEGHFLPQPLPDGSASGTPPWLLVAAGYLLPGERERSQACFRFSDPTQLGPGRSRRSATLRKERKDGPAGGIGLEE